MPLAVHLEHAGRLLSQRALPLVQQMHERNRVIFPLFRERQ